MLVLLREVIVMHLCRLDVLSVLLVINLFPVCILHAVQIIASKSTAHLPSRILQRQHIRYLVPAHLCLRLRQKGARRRRPWSCSPGHDLSTAAEVPGTQAPDACLCQRCLAQRDRGRAGTGGQMDLCQGCVQEVVQPCWALCDRRVQVGRSECKRWTGVDDDRRLGRLAQDQGPN